MAGRSIVNWRVFLVLFLASILGVILVMPFVFTLQADLLEQLPLPFPLILALSIAQSGALFFIFTFLGLWLAGKVNLGAPILQAWAEGKEVRTHFKSILGISCGLGILAAILIIAGDLLFIFTGAFNPSDLSVRPTWWQGLLASFYGGINEEILMRLFVVSLLAWIFRKIWKPMETKSSNLIIWLSVILSSLLFGLGHLPITASLIEITSIIVARAVILNGIGGVIFGWLYWKKGLESAMISHFTVDVVLYVVLPIILG